MKYEWDSVDFSLLEFFDWQSALVAPDHLHSKIERRFTALGFIGDRLFVCIYTWRHKTRRIISLRKANKRERKLYEQKT